MLLNFKSALLSLVVSCHFSYLLWPSSSSQVTSSILCYRLSTKYPHLYLLVDYGKNILFIFKGSLSWLKWIWCKQVWRRLSYVGVSWTTVWGKGLFSRFLRDRQKEEQLRLNIDPHRLRHWLRREIPVLLFLQQDSNACDNANTSRRRRHHHHHDQSHNFEKKKRSCWYRTFNNYKNKNSLNENRLVTIWTLTYWSICQQIQIPQSYLNKENANIKIMK